MAVEDSVAQDQIRAFVERIERMEEEKAALSSDIREIYAEAKGNGFDVKILRRVVTIRKQDANARMEQEALLELYMSALGMVPAPDDDHEERSRLNSRASQTEAALRKPKAAEKPDALAALRADPSLAIVEPANIKPKSEPQPPKAAGQAHEAGHSGASLSRTSLPGAEGAEDRDQITEPQPAKAAGSDLASPQALNGQVADIQPETADEITIIDAQVDDGAGQSAGVVLRIPAAPAPKYAAPGEITYETHPPEGVERSSVSIAFGNMGQDPVLIAHDLEKGTAQPIVKQGKVILDGWARFMQARDMRELDGQPMAYAVVQYDGEDPLIDAIRMNVGGRTLDDHQKKLIAAKLAQQNPKRKDDIYRAFEIFLEPV